MTFDTESLGQNNDQGSLARRRELIAKSYHTSVQHLFALLGEMFDAVDDSFFELANNAKNNNEQSRYFDAMRETRIKRKALENAFQDHLQQSFKKPRDSGIKSDDKPKELSLLQNDSLERQVAIDSMASRCQSNHSQLLLEIAARFTQLYPDTNTDDHINPLDPKKICQAFTDSCDLLDIDFKNKLIIYKQFDRHVMHRLQMCLEQINSLLQNAGVLPNISRTHEKSPSKTNQQPPKPEKQATPEEVGFSQIRELLTQWRHGHTLSSSSGSPKNHSHNIEANALVSMISSLEQSVPNDLLVDTSPQAINVESAVSQLINLHNKGNTHKIGLKQVDEDVINLVSMLFEFILEDNNLSAPIQVLICRLQIPILKVVIHDHDFFCKPNHPARKLLNSLAKAGIGWSNVEDRKRDKLYEKIHDIVHTILGEFNGDITLFDELQKDFSEFIERETRRARIIEQRTKEAEIGRIKSANAQKRVERVIQERLKQYELPQQAIDVIRNGWSRVMFLACLKDQSGSLWDKRLNTLDNLIWCLTPSNEENYKETWGKKAPNMLKELKSGLQEISYNTERLEENINELKQLLTDAFKSDPVARPTHAESKTAETNVDESPVDSQEQLNATILKRFLAKVDSLEAGTWVEFSLINGSKFRCKLATIIEGADCYIFINRMGLKVMEKSRAQLASELQEGKLQILEQALLLDRAMESVMGNLRRFSQAR